MELLEWYYSPDRINNGGRKDPHSSIPVFSRSPKGGQEENAQPLLCRNEENRVGKRLDPKGIFIFPRRGKPHVCALSVSCGSDEGILSREHSDQDLDAALDGSGRATACYCSCSCLARGCWQQQPHPSIPHDFHS